MSHEEQTDLRIRRTHKFLQEAEEMRNEFSSKRADQEYQVDLYVTFPAMTDSTDIYFMQEVLMTVVAAALVDIQTCPQDVPSLPAWFAEITLLAQHLRCRGILDALYDQVHLVRGRAGQYEVIDFLAVLFGYAISGEPTLTAFFERVAPFAGPFMALFGREQLPHRSTLSCFLADMDGPCVKALRALFEQDCFHHGFSQEQAGGLSDRQGRRLAIIDVDATRQAARQRALTMSPEYPAPQRRLEEVCAPGYTGRKRGEAVRSRTTILQAHT